MKKALITGVTGQDGSYLAEYLLELGYEIHGTIRPSTKPNLNNIKFIKDKIRLWNFDLNDSDGFYDLIEVIKPTHIFNLAAQSFVPTSWELPYYTMNTNGLAVLNLLNAVLDIDDTIKIYQASTSEMFGNSPAPQNELTPFDPQSPYAAAKLYAHNLVEMYRNKYNLFAVSGILFNHESPRRGVNFVTRKITHAVAQAKYGYRDSLKLGNVTPKRDWGFAGDYMKAVVKMMDYPNPATYVIGTGVTHSVKEFLIKACEVAGVYETDLVTTYSEELARDNEVNLLKANWTKAYEHLRWSPTVWFNDLVEMMVEKDMWNVKNGIIEEL